MHLSDHQLFASFGNRALLFLKHLSGTWVQKYLMLVKLEVLEY